MGLLVSELVLPEADSFRRLMQSVAKRSLPKAGASQRKRDLKPFVCTM